MDLDDRLRYGACWWCGEPDSLFRLEGARLAGSEPMPLPTTLLTPDDRDGFRVCPKCAVVFGELRIRHDAELAHAGVLPGSPKVELSAKEVDQAIRWIQRKETRNVAEAVRRALEERKHRAEGI